MSSAGQPAYPLPCTLALVRPMQHGQQRHSVAGALDLRVQPARPTTVSGQPQPGAPQARAGAPKRSPWTFAQSEVIARGPCALHWGPWERISCDRRPGRPAALPASRCLPLPAAATACRFLPLPAAAAYCCAFVPRANSIPALTQFVTDDASIFITFIAVWRLGWSAGSVRRTANAEGRAALLFRASKIVPPVFELPSFRSRC